MGWWQHKKNEAMQKKIIRNVAGKSFLHHTNLLFATNKVLKFADLRDLNLSKLAYRASRNDLPKALDKTFALKPISNKSTRTSNCLMLKIPPITQTREKNSAEYKAPSLWNPLEDTEKLSLTMFSLANKLKTKAIDKYSNMPPCPGNCYSCKQD